LEGCGLLYKGDHRFVVLLGFRTVEGVVTRSRERGSVYYDGSGLERGKWDMMGECAAVSRGGKLVNLLGYKIPGQGKLTQVCEWSVSRRQQVLVKTQTFTIFIRKLGRGGN